MSVAPVGRLLVIFGLVCVGLGFVLMFGGKIPYLGKLPGDLTFKKEHVEIFIPITTSIVLSILVNVILWLISYVQKH